MCIIKFYINDKLIINVNYRTYINIIFIINNKIYDIVDNNFYRRLIKSNNLNYNLKIIFHLMYFSGWELNKKDKTKYRELMKINYTLYNTLYVFFIYTKYYTIFNGKKNYLFLIDIYSKKIFNCRDLYRIISFI
jgi:hypothetical protein